MEIVLNKHVTVINNDCRYAVSFSHIPNAKSIRGPETEMVVTDKEGDIRDNCSVFKGETYTMEVAKDGTLGLVMLKDKTFICPIYGDKKCGGCIQYSDCSHAN